METSVIILMILAIFGISWSIDWAIVRWIIVPAVAAIWGVTLPFWPVMGLFLVVSMLFGGFSFKLKRRE